MALTTSALLLVAAGCTELPDQDRGRAPDTVPTGVLAAVPFQNRTDVAAGIFQLKLHNGTDEVLDVRSVQLRWAGLTTPVSPRSNRLAPGDRIDFPLPLVEATCVGDGAEADMPSLGTALARVELEGGRVVDAPVYDVKGFARKLYLESCERQLIAATVDARWVDVRPDERHDVTIDGVTYPSLPATAAVLQVTRRSGSDDTPITVSEVGGTLIFRVETTGATGEPVLVVGPGQASGQGVVRFVEGRCDAHARSEASQPFEFLLRIDLGDGVVRTHSVRPDPRDRAAMRQRAEQACDVRGDAGFVGQG